MSVARVLRLSRQSESPADRRLGVIFDQLSDAICTIAGGRLEASNRAFEELTGFLRREIRGEDAMVLAPRPGAIRGATAARGFSRDLLQIPGRHPDVHVRRKDGSTCILDLEVRVMNDAGEPLPHSRVEGAFTLLIFKDMSESRRMKRELAGHQSELRNAYIELERTDAAIRRLQAGSKGGPGSKDDETK